MLLVGVVVALIVILFVYGLANMVSFKILSDFTEGVQNDSSFANTTGMTILNDMNTQLPETMDNSVVIILGLMAVLISFLAWNAMNNRILLIILVFIIIFLIVIGGYLSNIWTEYSVEAGVDVAQHFPITNFVLGNYVAMILAFVGLALGVLGFREVIS